MLGAEELQIVNYDVTKKMYDKNNELKGYRVEITLETYVEREFDWIYNLSAHLDSIAQHQESNANKKDDTEDLE